MNLIRILPFAKKLMASAVQNGDIVIDATVGNGHDTVFLAQLVGEQGHVFGYDIQKQALEETEKRLKECGLIDRVTLFHSSHDDIFNTIPKKHHNHIAGAMFNLGYLPGGQKNIVTKPESTIEAVKQLLSILRPGGMIVLVVYHGHPEGKRERDELLKFAEQIDQHTAHVLEYRFLNQKNSPPFIVAIENRVGGSD
ncbi:class I SAM-dependent methyltransferase [Aeribacillus sp. FSL K6-2848]|uniref:tRNA (mnm(5)s(2)U34)-methyltransferase n=1 Tax=Aeribacillus sp. FSL K6-2848 TaxID=2954612 RepID=UPI0030FC5090